MNFNGGNNILIIGDNPSLNTLLLNKIMQSFNHIKTKYTFTNTCTETDLMNIIEHQKQTYGDEPVLVYLNNCINAEFSRNRQFTNMILNGRHLNIFVVLFMDHPVHFSSQIIVNFDTVIMYKDNKYNHDIRQMVYEDYFGFIPTFGEFNACVENSANNEILYTTWKQNTLYTNVKYKSFIC